MPGSLKWPTARSTLHSFLPLYATATFLPKPSCINSRHAAFGSRPQDPWPRHRYSVSLAHASGGGVTTLVDCPRVMLHLSWSRL
ncbi:hypothetical protein LY78DRAFT_51603 [Colletotrichum sublineola]|nr:hypothetical protein LY78DRAFT_51603 [Colletotrichum sublineola]